MNLTDPEVTGIDDAFDVVARAARTQGVKVIATEIVGLVPERFMPDQDAEAARLLIKPGRSVETALGR
jgi:glutamate formiminotransferase